ncbi:MAG: multidrug transporter [Rhodomicrobium sp.]|nr:MAG: multidrug transporter [Rhodomicrobium sp.]
MPALYLTAAILFEVIGTIALKHSATTNSIWYGALTAISYVFAFLLLWLALRNLALGPVYATWSGVGIALTAIAGVLFFNEKIDLIGLLGIGFIIVGIILLNVFSNMQSS